VLGLEKCCLLGGLDTLGDDPQIDPVCHRDQRRDGGVNGVKVAYEECEFGYATDKGVECYERLKSKRPEAVWPLLWGLKSLAGLSFNYDYVVLGALAIVAGIFLVIRR